MRFELTAVGDAHVTNCPEVHDMIWLGNPATGYVFVRERVEERSRRVIYIVHARS